MEIRIPKSQLYSHKQNSTWPERAKRLKTFQSNYRTCPYKKQQLKCFNNSSELEEAERSQNWPILGEISQYRQDQQWPIITPAARRGPFKAGNAGEILEEEPEPAERSIFDNEEIASFGPETIDPDPFLRRSSRIRKHQSFLEVSPTSSHIFSGPCRRSRLELKGS